ncbi:polysaccharide biosynthesis/export family protein [Arenibaculum pallidiluteum]|uniref:polysaccharide biosynthesis/export family protein n=1 Tax=Arenibaculum pallidiluteum TaxID=2812559 RepID=UPI001A9578D5|nr:polysaccharide biosynthesis/export family protein [Arenibaculum pallidiluteum]
MTIIPTRSPEPVHASGRTRRVAWRGFAAGVSLAVSWACADLRAADLGASGRGAAYRVGPGDVLRIVVYNDERLSGDFRIGPEGTISYPLAGTVPVAELTVDEIGRQLVARLAGQVPVSGAPAVQIAEYAPVYVVGNVARPGPYQFRPGMVPLELVSLAGGLRLSAEAENKVLQLIGAEQQLGDALLLRTSLVIRRARLAAEVAGQDFDGSSLAGFSDAGSQALLRKEVDLFNVRRGVQAAQRRILEDQRASYDQEIRSLEQSIRLHDEEITLLADEIRTAEGLMSRGHTTQTRINDLKRQMSTMKRDGLELRSFLARAHQRQLEVDQKLIELGAIWQRENAEDLREVELALSRANGSAASGAAMVDRLRLETSQPRAAERRAPSYSVIRLIEGERQVISITELGALQPGDVLRVESGAGPETVTVATDIRPGGG